MHATGRDQALRQILLDYLAAAVPADLPGADGLRKCDVLRQYSSLASSGVVPARGELIRRHPELSEAIERFFAENVEHPTRPPPNLRSGR